MGQRIVQVVTTIIINDSDKEGFESYTSTSYMENINGGRDSDVLAASRALEWVRKDLSKQLDAAGPLLHVVPGDPAPPCLSPQEDELPGMWEKSDLSGGEADSYPRTRAVGYRCEKCKAQPYQILEGPEIGKVVYR